MFRKLSDLETLVDKSQEMKKLVLAVSQDEHSLGAISKANKAGIIHPVLIGNVAETKKIIEQQKLEFESVDFIEEHNPAKCVEIAVKMVHNKEAHVLMKGNVSTPELLKGVLNKEWGLRTGKLLSHFALFEVKEYHKLIALTDVAMNIAPDLNGKVGILENSVSFFNKLGVEKPKVAVLGAIEIVNENMQATIDAALISKMNQRNQIKNCIVDGPLAFDNAISYESAEHKKIESPVAGDADLLLMPNIEVGNVLYKSLVFFSKAEAASVILGAEKPIVLTSRSDSEQSKFNSILLASLG